MLGKVEWYCDRRGYGFLMPDDGGADLFFHNSELKDGDEICEGTRVSFQTIIDSKSGKPKAVRVDLVA